MILFLKFKYESEKMYDRKKKRDKQELYNANYDNEIIEEMKKSKDLCYEYNNIKPSERELREKMIKKIFNKTGKNI